MQRIRNRIGAGLLLALMLSAGPGLRSAAASPVVLPQTVNAGTTSWFVADEGSTGGGPFVGGGCPGGPGLTIVDATIPSHGDPFDNAYQLFIDGTIFTVGATVDVTGTTLTAGPATFSGLEVRYEMYFSPTVQAARLLATFSNPTASPISATIEVPVNFGSDGGTTVEATSSGDTSYTAADRWLVTSDSGPGDPVNTTVFYGPGTPNVAPTSVTSTVFSCAGSQGAGATFPITVPAGETRSLMFFAGLGNVDTAGNTIAGAIAAAALFDDNDTIPADLLSGLTSQDQQEILNWDFETVVGTYEMCTGQGSPTHDPPILAAGLTSVVLNDLTSADLAGIDVIFVTNCDNFTYGVEYLSRLADIATAVAAGKVLILHDRYVDPAETILPGGSTFDIQRHPSFPQPGNESRNIDVLDSGTTITNGPGGVITNATLDGGTESNHGFAVAGSLPGSARLILSTNDPSQIVTFVYGYGEGAVVYSSIPLDHYLNGASPAAFRTIYAPNVVHYAAFEAGAVVGFCGNGLIETGEQCDDDNSLDGDCCSSSCQFEAATSDCQLDSDLCTIDQCDGAGSCVSAGNVSCQASAPPCEGGEQCNPSTGACDALPDAPLGATCDADSDACTIDECNGSGSCVLLEENPEACIDHYLCYKAKPTTPFTDVQLTLNDPFEFTLATAKKPKLICPSADDGGSGILDPSTHQEAYLIKQNTRHTKRLGIQVTDRFGTITVDTKKARSLARADEPTTRQHPTRSGFGSRRPLQVLSREDGRGLHRGPTGDRRGSLRESDVHSQEADATL